jgi:dTDP-4-dehydrorhamnose 3,5-epimerase
MRFAETDLPGVVVVVLEAVEDARGSFFRTFCADEFRAAGLDAAVAQSSVSRNVQAGTLRGMHFQAAPHAEHKLVRCARGAVHDVAIDLRRESPTYLRWEAWELSEDNGRMLFVPPGVAHGFQTLRDDTEVAYQMSVPFAPGAYQGVRYDDPTFAVSWPLPVTVISERDQRHPVWTP